MIIVDAKQEALAALAQQSHTLHATSISCFVLQRWKEALSWRAMMAVRAGEQPPRARRLRRRQPNTFTQTGMMTLSVTAATLSQA
jgi:hypothetical protein